MKITQLASQSQFLTGTPTGPAGGDAGGTYPNPTVTKLQGNPVCADTPATDDILTWDGTAWCPAPAAAGGLASITDGITTVTPVTDLTVPPYSLSGTTPNADVAWDRLSTITAGGSETLDIADGDTFDVTLTTACTFTLAGATSGRSSAMSVVLRGAYATTWPGSVTWLNGNAPNATGPLQVAVLWSFDGGTTWGGTLVGSGTTTTTGIDILVSDTTADFLTNEAGTAFLSAG